MRNFLIALILTANISVCKASDDNVSAKAELTNVTVYRLGAELQQSFKVNLKKQTQYIELSNISSSLEKNSLQIKCGNNVTVLGFEFSNTFLNEELKTPEYQKLEDSVTKISKEISKLNTTSQILKDQLTVLNSNKDIKGSQNGLSVAELIKLMDYYKSKSFEINTELNDIREKTAKLDNIIMKLQDQMEENKNKNTQKGGKLTIQLTCNIPGIYDFSINYLTQNAKWIPFYDVKTQNITEPFGLIYKAKISQTTGIDWKQVKLKLSTALPNQFGNAPILHTWFLQYVDPTLKIRGVSTMLSGRVAGVQAEQLSEVVVTGLGLTDKYELAEKKIITEPLYIVNGNIISKQEYKSITPQAIKNINVLKSKDATSIYGSSAEAGAVIITLKDELSDYVAVEDNTLTIVYDIDMPFDIATNGKDQVAILQTKKVDATYRFFSIPKLNDNTYLVAQIPNWGKLNLLDGDANIFFENTYIGKTNITASSVLDTFNLTVATDKRIFIHREKLKDLSNTQFLSSYKKEIFTYEITVKNNKNIASPITVKDQFPISSNKEIEVELTENSNAIVNTEIGELKWELILQPNEQKKIRFQYSIKYPKDKKLNL
jgi:hypothetical protein